MVRDQMLCIVTPPRAHDVKTLQPLLQATELRLDEVFELVGSVHFASLALLPPRPGATGPEAGRCSLMFELAIDENVDRRVLMNDIATHGLELLWPLYQGHWEDQGRPGDRRAWLAEFLEGHANEAAGGFIGARDRTREQIRQESALFRNLREMLRATPVSGQEDTQSVASRVIENAWNMPDTQWAETPAPRSFWRNPTLTPAKRTLLTISLLAPPVGFLALLLLLASLLAIAGLIALVPVAVVLGLPTAFGEPLFGGSHPQSVNAALVVAVPALVLLGFGVAGAARLVSAKLAFALLIGLALIIIPLVMLATIVGLIVALGIGVPISWWPSFCQLLLALLHLVWFGFIALAWLAAGAMALGMLFGIALLISPRQLGGKVLVPVFVLLLALWGAALHLGFDHVVTAGSAGSTFFAALARRSEITGIPAFDLLAWLVPLSALLTLWLLSMLRFMTRGADRYIRRLDRPSVANVERGQQVHKSVLASDSSLAGKVGHMISLAEIRRPVVINAWLLKTWLSLVTRIGHMGFVEGVLGHAQGIKFGHWHLIDGNRRMLFCSNFDGDFGSYLDDFIIGASNGINLFWRWTELRPRPSAGPGQPAVIEARNFPPTRLGVFRGCKYEQWFKTYARDSMLPHLYRYEAYNDSSKDVARATRLRDALFAARSRAGDDQIMRALES
jgi:hypothetical protein